MKTLLNPAWLRRLDRYLLLRYPQLWSVKMHYVLFYALLSYALLFVLLSFYTAEINDMFVPGAIAWTVLLLISIPAGGWLYRQTLFTRQSQSRYSEQLRLLLTTCCLMLFGLAGILSHDIISTKNAALLSGQQMVEDLNILNSGAPYWHLPVKEIFEKNISEVCKDPAHQTWTNNWITNEQESSDCHKLHYDWQQFGNLYGLDDKYKKQLLTSEELQSRFFMARTAREQQNYIQDYLRVAKKYSNNYIATPAGVAAASTERLASLQVHEVHDKMDRILTAQRYRAWQAADTWMLLFGFAFLLAQALLIYQHLGKRSTLIGLGLFTLLAYLAALLRDIFFAGLNESLPGKIFTEAQPGGLWRDALPLLLYFIVAPLLLWWLANGMGRRSSHSYLREMSLIFATLLLPAMLLVGGMLVLKPLLPTGSNEQSEWGLLGLMLLSAALYTWLLLPRLISLYLINRSLPRTERAFANTDAISALVLRWQPGWFKRLGHYLLINYPQLWSVKAHCLLFYSFFGYSLLMAACWLYPMSVSNLPEREIIVTSLVLLLMVPLGFWLYRQSHYHRYQSRLNRGMEQLRLMATLLCLLLFALVPVLSYSLLTERISGLMTMEEWADDVNTLNIGHGYLELYHADVKQGNIGHDFEKFADTYKHALPEQCQRLLLNHEQMKEIFLQADSREKQQIHVQNYLRVAKKYNQELSLTDEQILAHFYGSPGQEMDQVFRPPVHSALEKISDSYNYKVFDKPGLFILLFLFSFFLMQCILVHRYFSIQGLVIAAVLYILFWGFLVSSRETAAFAFLGLVMLLHFFFSPPQRSLWHDISGVGSLSILAWLTLLIRFFFSLDNMVDTGVWFHPLTLLADLAVFVFLLFPLIHRAYLANKSLPAKA